MPGVTLRPTGPGDTEFQFRVFMSTQERSYRYMKASPQFSDEFIAHHFRQQFKWQDEQYRSDRYPNGRFDVVLYNDQPVGRFYVDRGRVDYRIIDIAILPEFRGMRIGESLIRELQEEATSANVLISIFVEQDNAPAQAFYRRLGFQFVGSNAPDSMHWYMEFKPEPRRRTLILPAE